MIIEGFKQNGLEVVIKLIDEFRINILEKLEKTGIENNVFDKYQIHCEKELLQGLNFAKNGLWDLNFQNCLVINAKCTKFFNLICMNYMEIFSMMH